MQAVSSLQTEKYIIEGNSPVTAYVKGSTEAAALFAAPFIAVGALLVSAEALGPILAGGSSEFLTALKLTPEMLKYLAISNPALWSTIQEILEVEVTPPGVASMLPMTVIEYRYRLLKMLFELKGDQEPKQEPKTEPKPEPEPEPKPKPKPKPKPEPKPEPKPVPKPQTN